MADQDDELRRIGEVRDVVRRGGAAALAVDDLATADVPAMAWSGSVVHLRSVDENLRRGPDEVDYLCVRAPDGVPVAKGGVDYAAHSGAGMLWQFAVHPDLQGLGLGTRLIVEAEERVRGRGLSTARIRVDDDNDGALRLYLRLGYERCGRWSASWPALDPEGVEYLHHASGEELTKEL